MELNSGCNDFLPVNDKEWQDFISFDERENITPNDLLPVCIEEQAYNIMVDRDDGVENLDMDTVSILAGVDDAEGKYLISTLFA